MTTTNKFNLPRDANLDSAVEQGETRQFATQAESPRAAEQQVERQFEPLLDDRRASGLLGGIHPKTLQRLARTGQIPAYRVGRFWRYRASELDAWLRSKVNSPGQPARVDFTKEDTQ
jgi:excisionase family DNA binding protein